MNFMKTPYRFKEITAVFTGTDGSMGFKTSEKYKLWMFKSAYGVIYVSRRNMEAIAIPYSTESAFRKNWKVIEKG